MGPIPNVYWPISTVCVLRRVDGNAARIGEEGREELVGVGSSRSSSGSRVGVIQVAVAIAAAAAAAVVEVVLVLVGEEEGS